uniref:Uncharacterized protein n=1 Tax=Parascaris univalens TaxID=6257 RepID=A0A915A2E8_PARUN
KATTGISVKTLSAADTINISNNTKKIVADVSGQENSPDPLDEAVDRATEFGEPDCLAAELTQQLSDMTDDDFEGGKFDTETNMFSSFYSVRLNFFNADDQISSLFCPHSGI